MVDGLPLADVEWDDETEDFTKRTWDFVDEDDQPIDNLSDLSLATGRSEDDLAKDVLRLPFGQAAPERLIEECLARAGS